MAVIDSVKISIPKPIPDWIEDVRLSWRQNEKTEDIFAIFLDGSITVKEGEIAGLLIMHDGYRGVRPGTAVMPDFTKAHNAENPKQTLFSMAVNLIGLPAKVAIEILTYRSGSNYVLIAQVDVHRNPLSLTYKPFFKIVPLRTQGRSGSTFLMSLLHQHPCISVDSTHPHEFKGAQYYINMLRSLTQPSIQPNTAKSSVIYKPEDHSFPPNPYYCTSGDQQWALTTTGKIFPLEMANLTLKCIDHLYGSVESNVQKNIESSRNKTIFAGISRVNPFRKKHLIIEKQVTFPDLVNELYGHNKQIFLFRDPRDIICSIYAFYKKTGVSITGSPATFSDLNFPKMILEGFRILWHGFNLRSGKAHRINYEQLIANTECELKAMLEYLEVDASDEIVQKMITKSIKNSSENPVHQTSQSPNSSVGRWQTDMPENIKEYCKKVAGDIMTAAGYDEF